MSPEEAALSAGDVAASAHRPEPTPTAPAPLARARLGRAIVAAGPAVYFGWLLLQQIRGDWPVLTDPRLDWETALSFSAVAYSPHQAFGGHKQSGIGCENSLHGLHEYTNWQTITRDRSNAV